jgi:hypothetical protein
MAIGTAGEIIHTPTGKTLFRRGFTRAIVKLLEGSPEPKAAK